ARADMKDARDGNRTPFAILADFGNTGLADDLELWWEYEAATANRLRDLVSAPDADLRRADRAQPDSAAGLQAAESGRGAAVGG
ncbi:hypothetical protein, partial [Nocardia gipuzkoensis]|uniref:hypothetical protein n=1 Tax=Nocardia gipuzkoensis TaxID=2749991 RepID=UPI0015EE5715